VQKRPGVVGYAMVPSHFRPTWCFELISGVFYQVNTAFTIYVNLVHFCVFTSNFIVHLIIISVQSVKLFGARGFV